MLSNEFSKEFFIDENMFFAATICINKISVSEEYAMTTKKGKIRKIKKIICTYFKDIVWLCEKKSVNIKYETAFYDKIKLSEEAVFYGKKKRKINRR